MPSTRRPADYIFTLLVGSLYCYAVNLCILTTTVIQFSKPELFVTGLALFVLFCAAHHNRGTLLAAAVLLLLAGLYVWFNREALLDRYYDAGQELVWMVRGLLVYDAKYDALLIRLLCGAVALFAALFFYAQFSFFTLTVCGAAPFVLAEFMDYKRDAASLMLFLFCFSVMLIKALIPRVHKKYSSLAALFALPFCLLAVFLAGRMASADAPGHAETIAEVLSEPFEAVGDFLFTSFNPKYFSFQTTGFADGDNRLGGPVNSNARQVMIVDAPRRVYLSGATKNAYNGRFWEDTLTGGPIASGPLAGLNANEIEYRETAAVIALFDQYRWGALRSLRAEPPESFVIQNGRLYPVTSNLRNIAKTEGVVVHIGEYRTGTLFKPAKFLHVSINTGEGENDYGETQTSPAGDMQISRLLRNGSSYTYEYLDISEGNPVAGHILNAARRGFYRDWTELESFAGYSDYVYENFTALPETLPRRVRNLAEEVTRGCATDYERVNAIKDYLTQIPYTLTPEAVPEGADFVDHFLFGKPEGYCVYYASAMAVMLRCAGIPSRYKEGFLTPPSKEGGLYYVTNQNAHAWAEAYLEGYGWLTVEATAPYRYASAPLDAYAAAGITYEPTAMPYTEPSPVPVPSSGPSAAATAPAPPAPAEKGEAVEELWYITYLRDILLLLSAAAVSAVLGIFAGVQVLREKLRLRRVGRMPVNEQAQVYFRGLVKMTACFNYPVKKGETALAYGQRLRKRFAFKSDTVFFNELIPLYYRARYGAADISEKELVLMRDCYLEMVEYLRSARIRPHFAYLRFVRRATVL
ncbi:MAG: transglutaminase-like domain-containing protein [Clostridiales bacterium]|jgi:hypothetical protein|nr:transglutaminase-like domain-containing protein [Clostridiales bacterium]